MSKSKTLFSWFSSNEEGKVVAKTDVHEDGTINRYEYTVPDDISKGHGDTWYNNMEDFINDKEAGSRSKDAEESLNREWKAKGYNLTLEELKKIIKNIVNNSLYTTKKLILK